MDIWEISARGKSQYRPQLGDEKIRIIRSGMGHSLRSQMQF
jgi:hypothetical protein